MDWCCGNNMRRQVGSLVVVVFWATTIVCGFWLGGYNHFSRLVSELGAQGTVTRAPFAAGLLVASGLSLILVQQLVVNCRSRGLNLLPVLLILSYSFSIAGAAIFPLGNPLHGPLGSPSFLLLLSPPAALFLWPEKRAPRGLRTMSLLSLMMMCLGFLTMMPEVLPNSPGLKQRFFHLGWSVWVVYLSLGLIPVQERKKP